MNDEVVLQFQPRSSEQINEMLNFLDIYVEYMWYVHVAVFLSPFEVPLCLVFGPPVESYLFLGRFPEFGNESLIHREEHPGSLSDGLKVISTCTQVREIFA